MNPGRKKLPNVQVVGSVVHSANYSPLKASASQGLLLYGALPTAVISFVLTEGRGQAPQLSASIVVLSTFIFVFTIPMVLWLILEPLNEIAKKLLDRFSFTL